LGVTDFARVLFVKGTSMFTGNNRLRKRAKKVTKDLRKLSGTVQHVAQKKFRHLRANASEYYEQGRDQVQHAERAVEHLIQKRPLKSVLIAAGVGIVLGGFLFRRIATARARTKSAA
jgi:ElaB/YqjD/DUF883 family membrane-anchored ribosome-binding protein